MQPARLIALATECRYDNSHIGLVCYHSAEFRICIRQHLARPISSNACILFVIIIIIIIIIIISINIIIIIIIVIAITTVDGVIISVVVILYASTTCRNQYSACLFHPTCHEEYYCSVTCLHCSVKL